MTKNKYDHPEAKRLNEYLTTVYSADMSKPVYTPFETLGEEMVGKLLSVDGNILVISDCGLLVALWFRLNREGKSMENVVFVTHTEKQEEFGLNLVKKVIQIGYNKPIEEMEKQLMGMKFDVIIGNPPFNGKSSIHLKIVGLLEKHVNKNALIALILPKPILDRNSTRTLKYTKWLDQCTLITWRDAVEFPTVSDKLIYFIIKNDNGHALINLGANLPTSTFPAKRVVGIDFTNTSKKSSGDNNIPIYCCLGADGSPKFFRYTSATALEKIQAHANKPVLHVNVHGAMVKFPKIAWLDEKGEFGWFRQGIDSFVFDDLIQARKALNWINGPEGKNYISACLNGGWLIREQIQAIFKNE